MVSVSPEEVPPPGPVLNTVIVAEPAAASVVERSYSDRAGRQVDMLMVSSTDPRDAHSPEACLPSHGWQLREARSRRLDGAVIHTDRATMSGQSLDVLFWWDIIDDRTGNPFARVEALREAFRGEGSIMVRLTTSATADSPKLLDRFAHAALPCIHDWKKTALELKAR